MMLWYDQVTEAELEAVAEEHGLTLDQLLPSQRGLRATARWFVDRFL